MPPKIHLTAQQDSEQHIAHGAMQNKKRNSIIKWEQRRMTTQVILQTSAWEKAFEQMYSSFAFTTILMAKHDRMNIPKSIMMLTKRRLFWMI